MRCSGIIFQIFQATGFTACAFTGSHAGWRVDFSKYEHDSNLATAKTIPSAWYLDAGVLDEERKRVFGRSWQLVGRLDQVKEPGQYFTTTVAGEPVVLVRNLSGELKGFFNVCSHRAGPIALGEGNQRAFQCKYHGWLYSLDGELRNTPEFEGVQNFTRDCNGLKRIDVDVFGPFVFARLESCGPGLDEVLGKIPEETSAIPLMEMSFYKRVEYVIDCNWKVYVDNYLEGYHVPMAHPGLFRELDYRQYKVETERHYSKQYAPVKESPDSLYRRNLEGGAEAVALYYWVFPNLMLNIYPDNLQTNVIIPLDEKRTLTVFDWYLRDPAGPNVAADFEKSFAFSDEVQQEDIIICENVQRGLRSRAYDQGRYSVKRENGVHHFHGLLAEQLRGSRYV